MLDKDTYKTITDPSKEVLFKDKNSKFFGYAFPVTNKNDIKTNIAHLKEQHHSARHWCYAYQLGTEKKIYRANDDGEPSNSAGQPIYGQIQSFDLTNILIVIVRYFGGIKLGVSGLINAYKTAAKLALEQSNIIEKTINNDYLITFNYINLNKVMRIIKEKRLYIVNQKLELDCQIHISVRKKDSELVREVFQNYYGIQIKDFND